MTLPSAFASFDPFVERRPKSLFQVLGFEMLLLKNIHFAFSRLRNAYFLKSRVGAGPAVIGPFYPNWGAFGDEDVKNNEGGICPFNDGVTNEQHHKREQYCTHHILLLLRTHLHAPGPARQDASQPPEQTPREQMNPMKSAVMPITYHDEKHPFPLPCVSASSLSHVVAAGKQTTITCPCLIRRTL